MQTIETETGKHNVGYMCPICHNMMEIEYDPKMRCPRCGIVIDDFITIDSTMYHIVKWINQSKYIETTSCCGGHYIKPFVVAYPYIEFRVKGIHGYYPNISFNDLFSPGYIPRLGEVSLVDDLDNAVIDNTKDKNIQKANYLYSLGPFQRNFFRNIRITMLKDPIDGDVKMTEPEFKQLFEMRQTKFLQQLKEYAFHIMKKL